MGFMQATLKVVQNVIVILWELGHRYVSQIQASVSASQGTKEIDAKLVTRATIPWRSVDVHNVMWNVLSAHHLGTQSEAATRLAHRAKITKKLVL